MQAKALWAVIEPWLAAEHVELDDLEILGSGRGTTVRVLVDAEERLDLDRIAELSEGLSRLLDDEVEGDDPYRLEVSSPGLERKLKRPAHFLKSVGREVSVKARPGGETTVVKGHLASAGDASFVVTTEDGDHEFAYEDVVTAKTLFRWERAPKPGKK
jgi:ribosome maturation factor RimP